MHIEATADSTIRAGAPGESRPLMGFAVVAFLGVVAGVQMSDRGLQSILSPAIRETYRVGDSEMGLLYGLGGILVASLLALPLAKLADRYARKSILIGLILTWAGLTAVGGLAPNFPLFFIGRAASGITEFAMIPIVYSLIPDLVGERWRVDANLAFAALMATGASGGFYLGGNFLAFATGLDLPVWLGAAEPWRVCLLLLAVAGLPLAAVALLIREPPRHEIADAAERADGGAAGRADTLADFVRARLRPILLFVGAAGGLAVAVQAVNPMAAMAIVRAFAADLAQVGHGLGLVTLVTSLSALPIASLFDRLLHGRLGAGARPAMMMAMAILAVPCAVGLAMTASSDHAIWLIGGFLLTTSVGAALIPTVLQDLAPARLRARVFASYTVLISAFCAVGPLLSGVISDGVTQGDLMLAMALASVPALAVAALCAGVNLLQSAGPKAR